MTERTIPILPCRSIDDTLDFYRALGFEVTYRQERPNSYAVVQRGGIELQFFVLKALDPAQSYSTCYVLVSDVDTLYEAFTSGLRRAMGRLPSRGIPRINALKDMTYGVRQFVIVDPGGNYIRIGQPIDPRPAPTVDEAGRLERALDAATTLADSKMDDATAARVLDAAFAAGEGAPNTVTVRARILRADIAYRLGDRDGASAWLAEALRVDLSPGDRATITDDLDRAGELESVIRLENQGGPALMA